MNIFRQIRRALSDQSGKEPPGQGTGFQPDTIRIAQIAERFGCEHTAVLSALQRL